MAQTVFYLDLNEFSRDYLVTTPGVAPRNPAEFAREGIRQQASLFENFLLFDNLSFKVTGESIPLSVLIGLLGNRGFDSLVEQGALGFVL